MLEQFQPMDNDKKGHTGTSPCTRGVSPRVHGEVPAATSSPFLTRARPTKRESRRRPPHAPPSAILTRAPHEVRSLPGPPHQARFSPSRQESRSVRGRLVAFALGEEVSVGIAPGVAISVALGLDVVPAASRSPNPADAHRTKPESRRRPPHEARIPPTPAPRSPNPAESRPPWGIALDA